MRKVNILILAAGKGTRLNAITKPKVMYLVKGRPMIEHLACMLAKCRIRAQVIFIVGFQGQKVVDFLSRLFPKSSFEFVWQYHQLGTGHAVKKAVPRITNAYPSVVLNGDHPFFSTQTISKLSALYQRQKPVMIITTVAVGPDSSFGRVVKRDDLVERIIEYKNCTPDQKKIREGNVGAYLFDTQWLKQNINKIKKDQVSGEYYLPELVEIALKQNQRVVATKVAHPREAVGINTFKNLREAEETN